MGFKKKQRFGLGKVLDNILRKPTLVQKEERAYEAHVANMSRLGRTNTLPTGHVFHRESKWKERNAALALAAALERHEQAKAKRRAAQAERAKKQAVRKPNQNEAGIIKAVRRAVPGRIVGYDLDGRPDQRIIASEQARAAQTTAIYGDEAHPAPMPFRPPMKLKDGITYVFSSGGAGADLHVSDADLQRRFFLEPGAGKTGSLKTLAADVLRDTKGDVKPFQPVVKVDATPKGKTPRRGKS